MIRRVVPLVAGIAVTLAGLGIVFLADVDGDMRFFGWFIAAIGALGLIARAWIDRQGDI